LIDPVEPPIDPVEPPIDPVEPPIDSRGEFVHRLCDPRDSRSA
jgi:hypothetical protein